MSKLLNPSIPIDIEWMGPLDIETVLFKKELCDIIKSTDFSNLPSTKILYIVSVKMASVGIFRVDYKLTRGNNNIQESSSVCSVGSLMYKHISDYAITKRRDYKLNSILE